MPVPTAALAEVVSIYDTNASDIAAMLRLAADNIEKGDPAVRSMHAVAELEDGGIQIFGWGRTDTPRTLAMFQLALTSLSNSQLARWEDD